MAERDYAEIARKLRAKAADKATTADERDALIAKAEALEERIPKITTMDINSPYPAGTFKFNLPDYVAGSDAWLRRHAADLDDIVENGYRYNREDDW